VTRTGGWIAKLGVAALALWPLSAPAENDAMLATLDKPATVTVRRAPVAAAPGTPRRPRVIISVANYSPTRDCAPVEVVVKGRAGDGPEVEVGRFGITPDREFNAPTPPEAQRFALPLPSQLATEGPVQFSVHLVPVEGGQSNPSACATRPPRGDKRGGASLRLGAVEIQ
jgi:hypothetical protein